MEEKILVRGMGWLFDEIKMFVCGFSRLLVGVDWFIGDRCENVEQDGFEKCVLERYCRTYGSFQILNFAMKCLVSLVHFGFGVLVVRDK